MLEHSAAYVFAKCGEINAMCTCYNLLTIKLVQAADVPCIEYLARFRQPLKVVCDEWMRRHSIRCFKLSWNPARQKAAAILTLTGS